jgi:uncharacterized membrane protein YgcG
MRRFILLLVLALTLGPAVPRPGLAGDYPIATGDYVSDFAGLLEPEVRDQIWGWLEELERESGVEMAVVTVGSIADYGTTDTTIESFTRHLFDAWGVGHRGQNDGVLLLVAVDDRQCWIELGSGYPAHYDSIRRRIIQDRMIRFFRTNDYSRGILEGTRAVVGSVSEPISWLSFYKWRLFLGLLMLTGFLAGMSWFHSGREGWGWAAFVSIRRNAGSAFRLLSRGRKIPRFAGRRPNGRWRRRR